MCAASKLSNALVTFSYETKSFGTTFSIMSLPPELLIMIFDYIHYPLRQVRDRIRDPSTAARDIQDIGERMTRGKVFPYPYVDVCKYWSDVILAVPKFWTNTVLYTGPVKVYGKYVGRPEAVLDASRKLPIDITIRSTRFEPKFETESYCLTICDLEEEQMDIIMLLKLIAPHLHRCRSLSLYTLLMNTVPLMYRHLSGPAPLLKMVTVYTDNLMWTNANGLMTLAPDLSSIQSTFAPCPEQLVIDGFSFFTIHKYHEHLREAYASSLVSLAVVNYDFGARSWTDTLVASEAVTALQAFTTLDALKLTHLNFDRKVGENPPTADLGVRALVLDDMDDDALYEFFRVARFPDLEDIWFKRCWLSGHEYEPNMLPVECTVLTLEGVPSGYDISPVLKHWNVNTIRSCATAAFDDDVLEMIGSPLNPETAEANVTDMTQFCCDSLSTISIIACPNITITGMKRMVERRNRWIDYNNPEWRSAAPLGPAITDITMWELPYLKKLTKEDEEWFQARVAKFRIQSIIADHLAEDSTELDTNANM